MERLAFSLSGTLIITLYLLHQSCTSNIFHRFSSLKTLISTLYDQTNPEVVVSNMVLGLVAAVVEAALAFVEYVVLVLLDYLLALSTLVYKECSFSSRSVVTKNIMETKEK